MGMYVFNGPIQVLLMERYICFIIIINLFNCCIFSDCLEVVVPSYSVIKLLFSILRTISQNFQIDSSTEGSISKFLFEIACSASSSPDVDALKFRLVQYDKFYSGEQQEDASECLMMLIKLINKVQYHIVVLMIIIRQGFLYLKSYFHLCWKKYIVCDACGLRSPSFQSSSVLYITPTCTSSMQELIKQGMKQKLKKFLNSM